MADVPDDRSLAIRKLLTSEETVEEAAEVVLSDRLYTPADDADLAAMVKAFTGVGRRGIALLLLERYRAVYQASNEGLLQYLEFRHKHSKRTTELEDELSAFRPKSAEQSVRAARLWEGWKEVGRAEAAYDEGLRFSPGDFAIQRQCISLLIRGKQLKNAHRRLQVLTTAMERTAEHCADVAEMAGLLQDRRLLASMAAEVFPQLTPSSLIPFVVLARAYSHVSDRGGLTRLFAAFDVELFHQDWVLRNVLSVAERHGISDTLLRAAKRILQLGQIDPELKERARHINASFDLFPLHQNRD